MELDGNAIILAEAPSSLKLTAREGGIRKKKKKKKGENFNMKKKKKMERDFELCSRERGNF